MVQAGAVSIPGCPGQLEIQLISVKGMPKAVQWDKAQEVTVTFFIAPGYDEALGTGFIKSKIGQPMGGAAYTWGDTGQKLCIPFYCPVKQQTKALIRDGVRLAGSQAPELIAIVNDHNHIVKNDSFIAKAHMPFHKYFRKCIGDTQKQLQQKKRPSSKMGPDLLKIPLQDANQRNMGAELEIRVAFIPSKAVKDESTMDEMMRGCGKFRLHVIEILEIDNRRSAPNRQSLFVTVKRNWKNFSETDKDKRTTLVRNAGEAASFDQNFDFRYAQKDTEVYAQAAAGGKSELESRMQLEIAVKNTGVEPGRMFTLGLVNVPLIQALLTGKLYKKIIWENAFAPPMMLLHNFR